MTAAPVSVPPRLGTAAAILLPMAVPLALLLALALTLDGGEEALAALTGAPAAPDFLAQAPTLMPPPLAAAGGTSRRLAPHAEFAPDRIWGPLPAVAADGDVRVQGPPDLPVAWSAPFDQPHVPTTDAPAAPLAPLLAVLKRAPGVLEPAPPGELLLDPVAFVPYAPPAPVAPPPADNGVLWDTAAEVRVALGAMPSGSVQLRPWEGQEWLHLGGLLAYRCGMSAFYIGINGLPATESIPLEPCYEGTAVPFAQLDTDNFPPYRIFQTGKVQAVTVRLVLDDGSEMAATYLRAQILAPSL